MLNREGILWARMSRRVSLLSTSSEFPWPRMRICIARPRTSAVFGSVVSRKQYHCWAGLLHSARFLCCSFSAFMTGNSKTWRKSSVRFFEVRFVPGAFLSRQLAVWQVRAAVGCNIASMKASLESTGGSMGLKALHVVDQCCDQLCLRLS